MSQRFTRYRPQISRADARQRMSHYDSLVRYRRARQTGGFLYVAVLFTTLIVMVSVTAALSISTASVRSEASLKQRADALRLAESETQRLAIMMNQNSDWRMTASNDAFTAWYSPAIDGVANTQHQVRYRLTDIDGDLTDDSFDEVELTVHARVDDSEVALTITMESDPQPLDLLRYGVTAGDDIRCESGGAISSENPIQVSDDCVTSSWGFLTTPSLECNGRVEVSLRGDRTTSDVVMPGYEVVERYVDVGTEISRLSVPRVGTDLNLQDIVLSAAANPYGSEDASGIYWIDAQYNRVVISNARIDATLAILNATEIEVSGGIVWTYPMTPDVILATNSPVTFTGIDRVLSENARGVNYNPSSTPYRGTFSNENLTDSYPSELRGIVYSSSNIEFDPLTDGSPLRIVGSVIGNDLRCDGIVSISQFDEAIRTPPLGLLDPVPRRFVRGSARRIESPQ